LIFSSLGWQETRLAIIASDSRRVAIFFIVQRVCFYLKYNPKVRLCRLLGDDLVEIVAPPHFKLGTP
jgi:hypothetical protein